MIKKLIIISSLMLALAACEPTLFGMPQSQFSQLPKEQQQQVIESYNRQQEIKTQNAPLENLIGVLGTATDQQTHRNN